MSAPAAGTSSQPTKSPGLGVPYALLWAGQLCSMTGTMVQYIALPLWILSVTGSAVAAGVAFAVETLPIVVLAPWAGVLADSLPRRRLVVAAEVASAVIVLGMVAAVVADNVPLALLGAAAVKAINTVSTPALQGLLREITPAESLLPKAVSRFEGLTGATIVLGPPLGAVLFALLGAPAALLCNAGSFLLGALCVWAIHVPRKGAGTEADSSGEASDDRDGAAVPQAPRRQRPRLSDGLTTVRRSPVLRSLLFAEAAYFLCFGGATAAIVAEAARTVGDARAGWYPAAVGAAWVLVSMTILPSRDWAPGSALVLGAGFVPLAAGAIGLTEFAPLLWLVVGGLLAGVANSLIASGASLGWQQLVEPHSIGQVMALRRSVANGALALSSVLLPFACQRLGTTPVLVAASFLTLVLITALVGRRRLRGTAA
ncbi:MFS transporter [Streptomyces olindensis]|uniref:MFS transporter n=1 Tax=Streptomyces olindensis TaxID=358823 RepID=UPI0033DF9621